MNARISDAVSSRGQRFALGSEIASGGEGAVYKIPADASLAAKLYHEPLTADRAEKIRVMSAMATTAICKLTGWPIDTLNNKSAKPVGFLMPRFNDRHDIHRLYSPKSRREDFPRADWRFLIRTAANAARTFAAIHDMNCVIGDVNERSVLVGQDATVRLIDCDSFQIVANGRRFLCDVGVETFTPPELQGKSFKTVVRTENHDNFGLAVLMFLLLFMGRHPFAGRYLGRGDMTIGQAITENRFAYGVRRSDVNMERPPGTPPLAIVGEGVSTLFELAFSKQLINGGRPSAREWAAELAKLESALRQCPANASHWYLRSAAACPWCHMEATTGVSLFGFVLQGQAGTLFNLDALWRAVEAVRDPGLAPILNLPALQSSSDAKTVGGNETWRNIAGGVVALGLGATAISGYAGSFSIVLFGLAVAAFFGVRVLFDNTEGMTRYRLAFQTAETRWKTASAEWQAKAGPSDFQSKKAALLEARRRFLALPLERQRQLDELNQQRRRRQLERFLDRYKIEDASIDNIGPGRKGTLESYGIETAADVQESRINSVPGFGPKLRLNLLAWRTSIERRFRFDATKGVDPQDVAKVEHDIASAQKSLQGQLQTGLAELTAIANRIELIRRTMRVQIEAAQREFAQAKADYNATLRK